MGSKTKQLGAVSCGMNANDHLMEQEGGRGYNRFCDNAVKIPHALLNEGKAETTFVNDAMMSLW